MALKKIPHPEEAAKQLSRRTQRRRSQLIAKFRGSYEVLDNLPHGVTQ